jgi:hypothetical protein
MSNLIRIAKIKDMPDFPLRPSTLYKWRTLRKHPELFVTLGGCVFLDMNKLNELIDQSRRG